MSKQKPHKYTESQEAFLLAHRDMSKIEMTKLFNLQFGTEKTVNQIHNACMRRGYYCKENAGHWKKGRKPWNAGKEGVKGGNETSFKPGNVNWNTEPVGTVKQVFSGTSRIGYWMKKVSDFPKGGRKVNWRYCHHLTWEAHFGAVPAGFAVVFKDGDTDNYAHVANLALVTRKQLAVINRHLNKINGADLFEVKRKLAELILLVSENRL